MIVNLLPNLLLKICLRHLYPIFELKFELRQTQLALICHPWISLGCSGRSIQNRSTTNWLASRIGFIILDGIILVKFQNGSRSSDGITKVMEIQLVVCCIQLYRCKFDWWLVLERFYKNHCKVLQDNTADLKNCFQKLHQAIFCKITVPTPLVGWETI